MSLCNTADVGADIGIGAMANPDVLHRTNGYTCWDGFPLGEPVAKQLGVDGLGVSGPAPLDASPSTHSEEFSRLIVTQKTHPLPSNAVATADQCLKN